MVRVHHEGVASCRGRDGRGRGGALEQRRCWDEELGPGHAGAQRLAVRLRPGDHGVLRGGGEEGGLDRIEMRMSKDGELRSELCRLQGFPLSDIVFSLALHTRCGRGFIFRTDLLGVDGSVSGLSCAPLWIALCTELRRACIRASPDLPRPFYVSHEPCAHWRILQARSDGVQEVKKDTQGRSHMHAADPPALAKQLSNQELPLLT